MEVEVSMNLFQNTANGGRCINEPLSEQGKWRSRYQRTSFETRHTEVEVWIGYCQVRAESGVWLELGAGFGGIRGSDRVRDEAGLGLGRVYTMRTPGVALAPMTE